MKFEYFIAIFSVVIDTFAAEIRKLILGSD